MSKYVDGINEENMDKFLAALRSGEFQQGRFNLCLTAPESEVQNFCCLGVMAELASKDGAVEVEENGYYRTYDNQSSLPPLAVLEWLGLPEVNRKRVFGNEYNVSLFNSSVNSSTAEAFVTATELNDALYFSFTQIADEFEKEFAREA